jgi:group I intron endonuclease
MPYIYCVTNTINGKRYVGKTTKTIEERLKRHQTDAKQESKTGRVTYFHNALLKYGIDSFRVQLIEETAEPDEREKYWIAEYQPEYNLTNGGTGGDTSQSPNFMTWVTKHSEQMRGNTYRLGKPNPMTEERRQNIIASRLGKPHPHRGAPVSVESRRKISETLIRRAMEKNLKNYDTNESTA